MKWNKIKITKFYTNSATYTLCCNILLKAIFFLLNSMQKDLQDEGVCEREKKRKQTKIVSYNEINVNWPHNVSVIVNLYTLNTKRHNNKYNRK